MLWLGVASAFRLCEYNIHEGGHGTRELFEKFFVPHCDVAVINEANGWRRHYSIAERYGFSLELLTTATTYDIGILSRFPLVRGNETTTNMHHGLLHCMVRDVHVLATHLNPHSAVRRREEARRVVAAVRRLHGPVVVAGDLNTLSPLDDHDGLLPVLKSNPRLRAKFLVPGGDAIDYMPMHILLTDLVDVAVSRPSPPQPTVPTALHADKLHAAPMRLDYVLFNHAAAAHLLAPSGDILEVCALKDDYTDSASDHYPLVVTGLVVRHSSPSPGGHHRPRQHPLLSPPT